MIGKSLNVRPAKAKGSGQIVRPNLDKPIYAHPERIKLNREFE